MIRKGGYVIVDLTSGSLYTDLQDAIATEKPILLVDGVHTPYYVTTIEQGTNKITINGQFVVNSDNTTSGEITGLVLEGIFDKDGNQRFIGDDGEFTAPTGVNIVYNKYSLSGSHLMCVVAGNLYADAVLDTTDAFVFKLPQWVLDKIYNVWSTYIGRISYTMVDDAWSQELACDFVYGKGADNVFIKPLSTITNNKGVILNFRLQVDLLIDNE